MDILLIILLAYLDRLRGSDARLVTGDARLLMGWCLAAICGHAGDWMTLPFILLFALGEAPGWGTPLGHGLYGTTMQQHKLERWQFGILKTNVWYALIVRGAMWGAPIALLGYYDRQLLFLPLIFAVSMPFAVWSTYKLRHYKPGWIEDNAWARQEYIRGFSVGLLATLSMI